MKNIIVITGPTAVGKTKLSVMLAKKINGEIVNCDSMQFYRGLDIGTAKVNEEEKDNVVHHLFDIKDVAELYTIYDYQKDARSCIADILSRGKKVIMVGGSGLYIKAALYDYKFKEESIKNDYDHLTNEELYKLVLKINPNNDIHVNNRKRLIRFLNKSDNDNNEIIDSKPLYDFTIIGLSTDRKVLYDKINKRVDQMFENGLLEEVKYFFDKGIYSKAIMTGIGYKELYKYFNNEQSLPDTIELIKKNSRHYAKRQYTFFNNQFNIKWFNTDYSNFSNTVEEVYQYIKEK